MTFVHPVLLRKQRPVEDQKKYLIEKAKNQHSSKIFPCSRTGSWDESFTVQGDQLLLWYNTESKTTRILAHPLEESVKK